MGSQEEGFSVNLWNPPSLFLGAACSPLNGEIEADSLCLNTSFAQNILIFLFDCLIRFGVLPFLFSWCSPFGCYHLAGGCRAPVLLESGGRTRCFKLPPTAGERGRQGLGMDAGWGGPKVKEPRNAFPTDNILSFFKLPQHLPCLLGPGNAA